MTEYLEQLKHDCFELYKDCEALRAEVADLIRENEALHDVHDLLLAARAEVALLREVVEDGCDWVSVLDENDGDAANAALRLQWLPRARAKLPKD
jgi:regulator of replication initiation timing